MVNFPPDHLTQREVDIYAAHGLKPSEMAEQWIIDWTIREANARNRAVKRRIMGTTSRDAILAGQMWALDRMIQNREYEEVK